MKKSLFFTLVAVSLLGTVSCEQDPDTDKLDNDYLVYTNYDKNADFSSLSTFHIIDSILIIDDKEKPTYWNNQNSEKIIEAFAANLVERGYSATAKEDADMVLQLSYLSNRYYFSDYGSGPWWNNYPGYWNWGGWGWYPLTVQLHPYHIMREKRFRILVYYRDYHITISSDKTPSVP